jgi:hypothetical protein
MTILYTASKKFDPTCGESWRKYIEWSGLVQLKEVISLDHILCPNFFNQLTVEDWQFNVQEDFKIHLFHDLDHVLSRVAGNMRINVLALMLNPTTEDLGSFADPRFVFRGFDLVDHCGDICALTICGGFDKSLAPADLSECGLLTDHATAVTVQNLLRTEYPDEVHADCDLWAVLQMNP